jgi:hypothetical protein
MKSSIFPGFIGVFLATSAFAGTYTLNWKTPFQEKREGTAGLVGSIFYINKGATFREIRDQLVQGQPVKVMQAKEGSRGIVLVRIADQQGRPMLSDWYAPADLGLMTEAGRASWLSKLRQDCQSEQLATAAFNLEIQVGMKEECAKDAWGEPYRTNLTVTGGGTTKQMIYVDGYIYSQNGVISAIQQAR